MSRLSFSNSNYTDLHAPDVEDIDKGLVADDENRNDNLQHAAV